MYMKFENTGLEGIKVYLMPLDEIMLENGLVREGQWDYERVTYDRKFEWKDDVFYLRIQGYSVEGDIGTNKAVIQLLSPILGKHYYPHGVEYGDKDIFPFSLKMRCEKILNDIKKEIENMF